MLINKEKLKKVAYVLGLGYSWMCVITFSLLFFLAYISPQKSTILYINVFNESQIELVLILFLLPCYFYFFRKNDIQIYNEEKKALEVKNE